MVRMVNSCVVNVALGMGCTAVNSALYQMSQPGSLKANDMQVVNTECRAVFSSSGAGRDFPAAHTYTYTHTPPSTPLSLWLESTTRGQDTLTGLQLPVHPALQQPLCGRTTQKTGLNQESSRVRYRAWREGSGA